MCTKRSLAKHTNMSTKCDEQQLPNSKSIDSRSKEEEFEGEEEEEESLSLSDLPVNKIENNEKVRPKEAQDDFNFNSCGISLSGESQMCAADEVFFKGQILPFRHSVSSETGLAMFQPDIRPFISRSQSMDHRHTMISGFSSGSTTRSSSIRSSLSSGSSRSIYNTTTLLLNHQKPPRVRTRNRFHSHPSPTPQIRLSTSRRGNTNTTRHWSQKWRFFHMGSVQTPDIKFADLKIRNNNKSTNTGKNFGSRNSNSTSNSGPSEKLKMKKNYWTLFNDCKCTVDAIDQTLGRQLVSVKNSSSNSCCKHDTIGKGESREEGEGVKLLKKKEKGKQRMSRDRTFEWIKHLSDVDGGPVQRVRE